jgi:hypothetical protein
LPVGATHSIPHSRRLPYAIVKPVAGNGLIPKFQPTEQGSLCTYPIHLYVLPTRVLDTTPLWLCGSVVGQWPFRCSDLARVTATASVRQLCMHRDRACAGPPAGRVSPSACLVCLRNFTSHRIRCLIDVQSIKYRLKNN